MTQTAVPPAPSDDLDAPPPADEPPALTTATRYLCVGAYLDGVFRNRVLREVYHQPRRFVAPSYGFDLPMVLEACRRASALSMARDLSIVLVLGLAAYLSWYSAAAVFVAIVFLRVTEAAWRLARAFLAKAAAGTAVDTTKSPRRGLLMLLGWGTTVTVLIALIGKVVSATTASAVGHRHLGLNAALSVALVVFALPSVFALWRQKRIEEFTSDGRPPPVRLTNRMRQIQDQQQGNTVVYSNFEPFIGAGDVISSWSFAQRLVRKETNPLAPTSEGRREFTEPPFSAEEIVRYVRGHLHDLTLNRGPESSIPDMTVDERVYQSAREFGNQTLTTGPDEMAEVIRNPTNPRRHYIACQGIGWGGDVVTTVHIHLAVQGKSLYLEVTSTLLAPCNERYRVVDAVAGTGPRAWLRTLVFAIRGTPGTIVRAPVRLLGGLAELVGAGNQGRPRRGRRRRDDGARVSVRQLGTRDKLRNFTQVQDIIKFRKLIENRVYAHVLDFLDEHDVDTSEVRSQRATILNNNGIFVGGDLNVSKGSVTNQVPEPSND